MNNTKFKCSASAYLKSGAIYSSTIKEDDINKLYEKRNEFVIEHKESAENISFSNIMVIVSSVMKNTSKEYKLIEGEYTNAYITHLNKKS